MRSSTVAVVTTGILWGYSTTSTLAALAQTEQSFGIQVSEALVTSHDGNVDTLGASPTLPVQHPANAGLDAHSDLNVDPIGSPHPLPWSWVMDVQSRAVDSPLPQFYYYRSPALMSPSGTHATYSRMQIKRVPDANQSQVSSILFLENLETGDIQFLTESSPEMQHVLIHGIDSQQPGMLSMLMPISWTEAGDRVLVRAFESIFSTDIAADYAIVWYQASNQVEAVVPTNAQHSNAILLGWSQNRPDQVLFRVGNLGDETWPLVTLGNTGNSVIATTDQPITYGQTVPAVWNGPQNSAFDATVVD